MAASFRAMSVFLRAMIIRVFIIIWAIVIVRVIMINMCSRLIATLEPLRSSQNHPVHHKHRPRKQFNAS
jgi:hypothetical protein